MSELQMVSSSATCTSKLSNTMVSSSLDIKSAVLHMAELSRDIYIRPSPEPGCRGTSWPIRKYMSCMADGSLRCAGTSEMVKMYLGVFCWLDLDSCITKVLTCHRDD